MIRGDRVSLSPEVRVASGKDRDRWDRFVDAEQGSFFHYFDWGEYYARADGRRRYVPLVLEDEHGDIQGIFPLVEDHNALFGTLISLPEGYSCGYLTRSGFTGAGKDAVIQAFLDYIDGTYSRSCAYFSLEEHLLPPYQDVRPSQILEKNGYRFSGDLTTKIPGDYILLLKQPWKENVFNRMQKRLRTTIRKTVREGAVVIIDKDLAYLDTVLSMQVAMIRKFGIFTTPDHYQQYIDVFRNRMKLFVCLAEGEPVSSLLCYYTQTTAYWWIGPYNTRAKKYNNNLLPICSAIRDAGESGYRYFDMGSTLTSSLGSFKEKFGATCFPLMAYKKIFSRGKLAVNRAVLSLKRFTSQLIPALGLLCGVLGDLQADYFDIAALVVFIF